MPSASRHAKPSSLAPKLRVAAAAATTLAGVAAAFVFMQGGAAAPQGGSPAPGLAQAGLPVTSAGSGVADFAMMATIHRAIDARIRQAAETASRRHRAALLRARQQAAQAPAPSPSQSAPPSSGTDAASSPLGICIRNAEEGGSYAWGPGNGGGAYQFLLSTWEAYGGAASQYGVAGPAYQNQIFDNAIAAGGASNWTNYDGC